MACKLSHRILSITEYIFKELLQSVPSEFHLPWLPTLETMIKPYNLEGLWQYFPDISSIIIISHSIYLCKIYFQWLLGIGLLTCF